VAEGEQVRARVGELEAELKTAREALDIVRDRRGRTYDPALADLFCEKGGEWFDRLARIEPWDAVLALEPEPHRTLEGDELDAARQMSDLAEARRILTADRKK